MVRKNTFSKTERLTSEKDIHNLFKNGKSGFSYPIKFLLQSNPSVKTGVKVLISVPKRNFKHAVNRNRFKRLIREAYRIHKHELEEMAEAKKLLVQIAFIYVVKDEVDYKQMEISIRKILKNCVQMI